MFNKFCSLRLGAQLYSPTITILFCVSDCILIVIVLDCASYFCVIYFFCSWCLCVKRIFLVCRLENSIQICFHLQTPFCQLFKVLRLSQGFLTCQQQHIFLIWLRSSRGGFSLGCSICFAKSFYNLAATQQDEISSFACCNILFEFFFYFFI